MNEIKVVGKINVHGVEINCICGGFGNDNKIITAKDISILHWVELKHINELINKNITRFKNRIDYIDLLSDENFKVVATDLGLIGSNRTKNVYVLSERGYGKLIKIMDSDLAWDIYDEMLDNYFTMREVINSDEQLKAMYLLKAVESTGEESAMAIKCYSDIRIKEATKPLLDDISRKEEVIHKQEDDIQIKKDIIEGFTNDIDLYTKRSIVNRVIKKCTNGNYSGRYKEMYKCFKETFSIDLEARCKGYNLKQTKKKDQLSVIKYCEKFNYIDGLYEVACKLYHTEVQELLKELGKIVE